MFKKLFFSHLMILAALSKSINCRYMGLFLDSQFYSIDLPTFIPVPHFHDYCSFVVSFEIEKWVLQ